VNNRGRFSHNPTGKFGGVDHRAREFGTLTVRKHATITGNGPAGVKRSNSFFLAGVGSRWCGAGRTHDVNEFKLPPVSYNSLNALPVRDVWKRQKDSTGSLSRHFKVRNTKGVEPAFDDADVLIYRCFALRNRLVYLQRDLPRERTLRSQN